MATTPELESDYSQPLPERVVVTDGLVLERLHPTLSNDQDVDALIDRNRDFYREFASIFAEGINSPEDAKRFLKNALIKGVAVWGLRVEAMPRYLAGMLTLFPEQPGSYEISYVLDEDAQHRGLATRAVESLTTQVFAQENAKITAKVDPKNIKSIAVLERCGFQQVGADKDGNLDFKLLPPSPQ